MTTLICRTMPTDVTECKVIKPNHHNKVSRFKRVCETKQHSTDRRTQNIFFKNKLSMTTDSKEENVGRQGRRISRKM